MKILNYIIILFPFLLNQVTAQNFSREYGTIAQEELEMKSYSRDQSAAALVIYDIGKSYFEENDGGLDVIFERTQKLKILSDAGIAWAEISIPIYQEGGIFETVTDLEAYTYNLENGIRKKTALNPAGVHEETINQYWKLKKFAMPDAKAGSVIEIKYKIRSQYIFNLRDWEFQWKIPVVYSEYEVRLVPFYEYSYFAQGISKFYSQSSKAETGIKKQFGPVSYNDMVHKFVMMYVPAFNDEEYITTINDYIMKIDFQLSTIHDLQGVAINYMTTWPELIKELEKSTDFGKYIERSQKLSEDIVASLDLDGKSGEEKFNSVVEYVKMNYNWDGANGRYASKTASDFMSDKHGNCADMNLFTVGMLRAAGVEAYAVWTSTRENGKIKYDYPYTNAFNYVLLAVKLDGHYYLSDVTETLSANYRIPYRCINDKGLVIRKDLVEWLDLQCTFASEISQKFLIGIDETGLSVKIDNAYTEYDALINRKEFGDDNEKIIQKVNESGYRIIDTSVLASNYTEITKPYIISYTVNDKAEIVNGKLYISPFLKESLQDNPLTGLTRTYPVDMTYPRKRTLNSTIIIPEGYTVDFMPESQEVNNDIFEMKYTVQKDGNEVNISFMYFFKKGVYQSTEYSRLKSYFSDIVKKGNDKLVLSPISL